MARGNYTYCRKFRYPRRRQPRQACQKLTVFCHLEQLTCARRAGVRLKTAHPTPITVGLELTNPGGVPTLKLNVSGTSSAFTLVSGAAPQRSGTRVPVSIRYLGELHDVVAGKADITAL
jgi:hypothetical protein